jgi:triphosphoribosyl-dephospho-CoA synthase
VLQAGWPDTSVGRKTCQELDAWLRADGHRRNPGTTADLVAATLFAALRDRDMQAPRFTC